MPCFNLPYFHVSNSIPVWQNTIVTSTRRETRRHEHVCVRVHPFHTRNIKNLFGNYFTIKCYSESSLGATGHVVVAANTGPTAAVPHPSATRIGHPQNPIRGSRPQSGPWKRGVIQRHRGSSTREDLQPPCPAGMQHDKRIEIKHKYTLHVRPSQSGRWPSFVSCGQVLPQRGPMHPIFHTALCWLKQG